MGHPFVGEIRLVGFNFEVDGWAFCDGRLLPISENEVLFQLIGTTYGGDGETTFALPDLRGRVPIHQGNSYVLGEQGGSESVTLGSGQLPSHNHPAFGSSATASLPSPTPTSLPALTVLHEYVTPTTPANMTATPLGGGGGQPHENMMPYLCMNYIISLFGIFPTQN